MSGFTAACCTEFPRGREGRAGVYTGSDGGWQVMPAQAESQANLIRRSRIAGMALALFFLSATTFPALAQPDCHPSNRGMSQMQSAPVVFLNDHGQRVRIRSFIADDDLERASGYQYICPEVIARTTILFRFPEPLRTRFHMQNVKAPLAIGFFDQAGVLIQSMTMHPYSDGETTLYGPMQRFQYALEARPGFFTRHELSAGAARLLIETLP